LLFVLELAGCSLSGAELARSDIAQNQCKTDDDCFGARCSPDGVCLGSDGALTALLVTVTPPPTLSGVTSLTYYKSFESQHDSLPASGGGFNLELDPGIDVTGQVSIDIDDDTAPCWPALMPPEPGATLKTYIPADITFTPSEQIAGVAPDVYRSSLHDDGTTFEVPVLPPGYYDVYVAPHKLVPGMAPDPACQLPPQLYLKRPVSSGVNFALPAPSKLVVDVKWPLAGSYSDEAAADDPLFVDPLAGWKLDLVEPNTGRVLSAQPLLTGMLKAAPIIGATSVTYETTLVYSPPVEIVEGDSQPAAIGDAILRLTPPVSDPHDPTGQAPYTAPSILAQLDGAMVGSDRKSAAAQIVQPVLPPAPVHVVFQTGLASDGTPVAASIFLRATAISGITGISTSFSRSVEVGTDGVGEVELLPGRYHVSGAAKAGCSHSACLGIVEADWVVAKTPAEQAGKLIEFAPPPEYQGQAFVYGGAPAVGATVSLAASPLIIDANVLNVGDGSVAPVPASSAGVVDPQGNFTLAAEAGTYVLRVEPDTSTNYGWYVRPGFTLPDDQDAFGELDLGLPIFYKGTVTANTLNGPIHVPQALIRAYAYVDASGAPAMSAGDAAAAVQVAETYSEDASANPGAFTLLIPPSLVTR
jgi:hypothetical protein